MSTPTEQQSEGAWKGFRGRLQEAWGALSNDDLDRYAGQRDQLVGYIQRKTGETREQVREQIDKMAKEAKYRF